MHTNRGAWPKSPKILFILDILEDTDGKHFAFRFTSTVTGRQVCATISGRQANILAMLDDDNLALRSPVARYYWTTHILSSRAFHKETSAWLFAGSSPTDIAAFVQRELRGMWLDDLRRARRNKRIKDAGETIVLTADPGLAH